jgi:hypothetical protein
LDRHVDLAGAKMPDNPEIADLAITERGFGRVHVVGGNAFHRTRLPALRRRQRHAAGGKRSLSDALGGVAVDLGAIIVARNRPDFERQGLTTLTY